MSRYRRNHTLDLLTGLVLVAGALITVHVIHQRLTGQMAIAMMVAALVVGWFARNRLTLLLGMVALTAGLLLGWLALRSAQKHTVAHIGSVLVNTRSGGNGLLFAVGFGLWTIGWSATVTRTVMRKLGGRR